MASTTDIEITDSAKFTDKYCLILKGITIFDNLEHSVAVELCENPHLIVNGLLTQLLSAHDEITRLNHIRNGVANFIGRNQSHEIPEVRELIKELLSIIK